MGPWRGLEPARLVPHDQRFSISRSRRESTGRISDVANDENVETATEAIFLWERERESCTQDNTDNWDSLLPFSKDEDGEK